MDKLPFDVFFEMVAHLDSKSLNELCICSRDVHHTINIRLPLRKRRIQVCYLLDATASMSFVMGQLVLFFKECFTRLHLLYQQARIEIAVVFYWDYDKPSFRVKYCDFGTSFRDILENLECVHIDGGGDIPEAEKTGYYTALSLAWHPYKCSKFITRVGDAPMHSDLYPTGYDTYGCVEKSFLKENYDAVFLAKQLRKKHIQVIAIGIINPYDLISNQKHAFMVMMMHAFNCLMVHFSGGIVHAVSDVIDIIRLVPESMTLLVDSPESHTPSPAPPFGLC